MKLFSKFLIYFLYISFSVPGLYAQDSVDVTFRFKNNTQPYLVGEFNGWNNTIWPMSYNGVEWVRTARLAIGGNPNPPSNGVPGAWQYKFYYSGVSPWPNDPLNHHTNGNDNFNTFIYTKDPTIYHLLPNIRVGAVDNDVVNISAYIFPKVGSVVDTSAISLYIDGTIYDKLGSNYSFDTNQLNFTPPPFTDGQHIVVLDVGTNADTVTFTVVTNNIQIQPLPGYAKHGVTLPSSASNDSTTFRLQVDATDFVFLRIAGEGQDPRNSEPISMRKDISSSNWWVNVKLEPGKYSYLYDNNSAVAFNDPWGRWTDDDGSSAFIIGPEGLTADNYNWQSVDYEKPPLNQLVIYELHVGEFAGGFYGMSGGEAGFSELQALLPYLDSLGVNAIELMPVNDVREPGKSGHSWGYDHSSYFALEPAYGSPVEFKALIDSAHSLGIAVILDVVFNHLHDLGSLWLMNPDETRNPFFKLQSELNYNEDGLFFFKDIDHWSNQTQELVYEVLKMWIEEYRIDGFRYDFTQGIGWNVDEPDKGILGWVNRIQTEYNNSIYQIAEHLPESPALIFRSGMDSGWHDSFRDYVFDEARFETVSLLEFEDFVLGGGAKASNDNPSIPGSYGSRTEPVNMTVSHDEQTLIYEMRTFQGVSEDDAVKRDKLYATFMFTSLGVPMIWQGMEFSEPRGWQNEDQKLSYRPVDWSYRQTERGQAHYDYYKTLIYQRRYNPALYQGELKKLYRYEAEDVLVWGFDDSTTAEQVMVIANFSNTEQTVRDVPWLSSGDWYNIFDESVFSVAQTPVTSITIPGYTANAYSSSLIVSVDEKPDKFIPEEFQLFPNYPNPFNPSTTITFRIPIPDDVRIEIYNITGQRIRTLTESYFKEGKHSIVWNGLDYKNQEVASGLYFINLVSGDYAKTIKIIKLK